MADLKVRNLDDAGARALRARAKASGVSLEEKLRRTLTASVAGDREELVRRAKALHAAGGGKPGKPELDGNAWDDQWLSIPSRRSAAAWLSWVEHTSRDHVEE